MAPVPQLGEGARRRSGRDPAAEDVPAGRRPLARVHEHLSSLRTLQERPPVRRPRRHRRSACRRAAPAVPVKEHAPRCATTPCRRAARQPRISFASPLDALPASAKCPEASPWLMGVQALLTPSLQVPRSDRNTGAWSSSGHGPGHAEDQAAFGAGDDNGDTRCSPGHDATCDRPDQRDWGPPTIGSVEARRGWREHFTEGHDLVRPVVRRVEPPAPRVLRAGHEQGRRS